MVIMTVVTTIATPLLLRVVFARGVARPGGSGPDGSRPPLPSELEVLEADSGEPAGRTG